jgi:phospholipid transport system substrate-binding protein
MPILKKIYISLMKTKSSRTVVLAVAAVVTIAGQAAADGTPEQKIRSTIDSVMVVLTDESLERDGKIDKLRGQLDSCCMFETTSKLVLARNWKEFTPEQQSEFVELFKKYLIATYGKNVDGYAGERVEIIGGREETRGDYTVQTRIDRGGSDKDLLVDYRLRKNEEGDWRIIDVIGEGISLVANLRSQLQEVMSRGGPAEVLDTLRKKAQEGDQDVSTQAYLPAQVSVALMR